MRFKVIDTYTDECVLETDSYKEAISKLKDLELKDYRKHQRYEQKCIESFEDPTIDERPAPYYVTYYIKDKETGRLYDITDYCLLEKEMKQ